MQSTSPFKQSLRTIWIFAIAALCFFGGYYSSKKNNGEQYDSNISQLLNLIRERYVDSITAPELEQKSISAILEQLDPHSVFLSAKEVSRANEGLIGNFQGIGVEFLIFKDTVRILKCIADGPSEKAGLHSGDCILEAENEKQKKYTLCGTNITEEGVFEALRGPENSKVKLKICRLGSQQCETLELTRAEIPIPSIDCVRMLKPKTGYIKIQRFGAQTHKDFVSAVKQLTEQGLSTLVIDLRGNGGGYLNAATAIADELLPDGLPIVYTQGAHQQKTESKSSSGGCFETQALYILIDEESASASEILAGAIQDNDRGTIIGRRSFGKGLVQDQITLHDGSVLRLTVARYYTPTGRCIQRPYEPGKHEAYEHESIERYTNGELFDSVTTKQNKTTVFKTPKGKRVYGGGGISPDILIALDTVRKFPKNKISYRDLQYACASYVQMQKTKRLQVFNSKTVFLNHYVPDLSFKKYTSSILSTSIQWNATLLDLCKAYMGRFAFDDIIYYTLISESDDAIKKTMRLIP